MKKYIHLLAGLLSAGMATSLHAQFQPTDLIVGFEATGGTGAATNFEVDVGSSAAYAAAAPGTYNVADLGSALISTYGSVSDSQLYFGVAGNTGSGSTRTLWASSAESGAFPAPAYNQNAMITKGGAPGNAILTVGGGLSGSYGGSTTVSGLGSNGFGGGAVFGVTIGSGDTISWTTKSGGSVNGTGFAMSQFGALASPSLMTNATAGVADLYQITNGSSSTPSNDVGFFTLNTNGLLTFTVPSPIPEPSTYAAILGAAALGFVMLRRRSDAFAAE